MHKLRSLDIVHVTVRVWTTLCMHVVVSAGDPHRAFTEVGYKKWFQLTLRDRDFREGLTFFGRGKVNVKSVGNGPPDR
ncbi:BZ3500_MvSof-1268-A1-R1_Chr3-3g06415 [Microbotryum saponariae]|uniref:BZ3500_MvSof-1268-A1-R1_Chr3-3g06415 protein n=1 Tax=Microbotryum saponariae TaxID=289078 RepID=A0A2X0L0M4_9BASI|nr:BZ3500_MvSof-1268-A1-R1_Chr3-3g06415 [Microbotryum saponariae]SDA04382.1 BZ3501_MvSof-1269-A2-R1_Chr3-2g06102 [Microbotryum saponariae]